MTPERPIEEFPRPDGIEVMQPEDEGDLDENTGADSDADEEDLDDADDEEADDVEGGARVG